MNDKQKKKNNTSSEAKSPKKKGKRPSPTYEIKRSYEKLKIKDK